ncbi:DUF2235 domain-containing protein [Paenirhodobacter sp.]|uniref:DUF2235 domain-containing protein n=1 Tax=Paenirhodobacter sp. TaxID=1965326 RepID=UPI003B3EFBCE
MHKEREPRVLIVFADGTGNAFSVSQTNIWRLYTATDQSDGGQIARYIPGVGTHGNSIIRLIDGATGFGVPSNVRKLYRFLCWNWRPGDRILLFGFSRGAFTVRTLAGMIARQGLMPAERDDRPVSTAEMRRNARGAWRAYRKATLGPVWPTIAAARLVRDGLVTAKRWLFGQKLHGDIEKEVAGTKRRPVWPPDVQEFTGPPDCGVTVDFLGVFDTVEAYGMPVEELRGLIDRLIFPLNFANGVCAPCVLHARHALAIDEERLSFHPVAFETPSERAWQDVRQMWFPGVHSDIGGGYPEDHGAVPPLQWILDGAREAGLRVAPTLQEDLIARRFDLAPIHDSRKGLAAAYRYQPRHIDPTEEADPTLPAKLEGGADLYGPISPAEGCMIAGQDALPPLPAATRQAIAAMVFRYRLLNRAIIAIIAFFCLYPLRFLFETGADGRLTILSEGLRNWVMSGLMRSGCTGAGALLFGGMLYVSGWNLRDRIRDAAAAGWRGQEQVPKVSRFWHAGARMAPKTLEYVFACTILALVACTFTPNSARSPGPCALCAEGRRANRARRRAPACLRSAGALH